MKEIGVGIVGYGFMGRTHGYCVRNLALFYQELPFHARVMGVCSRREETLSLARLELEAPFTTTDYDALLAREDIQVISICTPNHLHEEMFQKAIVAGKHIYIDKPLATDGASAQRMADAAKKSASICQMAFNNRFFPSVMRAKELAEEGRLGRIISARAAYLHAGSVEEGKPAGWKQDASICGGGVLLDLGSHALDLLVHLCGGIESVFCQTQTLYPTRKGRDGNPIVSLGEDAATLLLRFESGAQGSMECSKIATGANDELTLEIHGTKGALCLNLMDANWLEFFDNTLPETPLGGQRGYTKIECVARYEKPAGTFLPPKNAIGWVRAHMHSYYSFLQSVHAGRAGTPSIEEGNAVQRIMDCAYTSAQKECWVNL